MSKGTFRALHTTLGVLSAVATALLWGSPLVLVGVLVILGLILLWLHWHPKLLYIYIGACIGGPLAEALAIHFGAWQYTDPHLLGVPLWLPFLWGNAALFIAGWRGSFNK